MTYTAETTMVAYDDLGGAHTLNVYFTNTGPNTWEVDVYDGSTATPGGGHTLFLGPAGDAELTFDPTTGALTPARASPRPLTARPCSSPCRADKP